MRSQKVSFSALLLDFDGVILESTEIKTQAFIEMFRDYPEHLEAFVAYHQKHLGMSRYKKFAWIYKELLKKPLSETALKVLGDRFSQIVFDKIMRTQFVPGALGTLVSCSSLGIPIFIISGTPHEELNHIINLRNIRSYVTESWGSPTEKTAAIQYIRNSYGFETNEMLFVGDGYFDYQAAKSEGVPFLARESGDDSITWTRWGVPSVPDLRNLATITPDRPTTIVTNNENVPNIILTPIPNKGVTTR